MLELVQPPVQRKPDRGRACAAAGARGRQPPRIAQPGRQGRALHRLRHQAAGFQVDPRQRRRHEAAAQASQLGLDLVEHAVDRQHILAGQQVDRQRCGALGRVGHRHCAVAHQLGVADRLGRARERVVRRDREYEVDRPQFLALQSARQAGLAAHPDRQVGLAGDEGFHGAGQHLGAQPQPGRRPAQRGRRGGVAGLRVQGIEALAQLEQGEARDHVVGHHRELGFPTGRDPLDPVRHRLGLGQQAPALDQQLGAGGGHHGLARAAVEQQHVERLLELAHVVGQGRRHLAEFARCGGKAAAAGDGIDHRQRLGRQGIAAGGHEGQVTRWAGMRFILFER